MKKAEQYIEDFWGLIEDGRDKRGQSISGYDVLTVIKRVQQDSFIHGFDTAKQNPDIDYMKLKL